MFQIEAPMFPLILVTIDQIVKKWQQFFEIQDGGDRHLEFWKLYFWRHRYDLNRSPNVFKNFGDDRSSSKEIAAVFRNPRWRRPPSWIMVTYIFRRHWCVLNQSSNIPTKFGDNWSNSNEMATVFLNSRWRSPPCWIFLNMHFWRHRYIPNRILNVSTNFGDDRSYTREIAAVFQNPRWRQLPFWKVHFWLNHHYEKWIPSL